MRGFSIASTLVGSPTAIDVPERSRVRSHAESLSRSATTPASPSASVFEWGLQGAPIASQRETKRNSLDTSSRALVEKTSAAQAEPPQQQAMEPAPARVQPAPTQLPTPGALPPAEPRASYEELPGLKALLHRNAEALDRWAQTGGAPAIKARDDFRRLAANCETFGNIGRLILPLDAAPREVRQAQAKLQSHFRNAQERKLVKLKGELDSWATRTSRKAAVVRQQIDALARKVKAKEEEDLPPSEYAKQSAYLVELDRKINKLERLHKNLTETALPEITRWQSCLENAQELSADALADKFDLNKSSSFPSIRARARKLADSTGGAAQSISAFVQELPLTPLAQSRELVTMLSRSIESNDQQIAVIAKQGFAKAPSGTSGTPVQQFERYADATLRSTVLRRILKQYGEGVSAADTKAALQSFMTRHATGLQPDVKDKVDQLINSLPKGRFEWLR